MGTRFFIKVNRLENRLSAPRVSPPSCGGGRKLPTITSGLKCGSNLGLFLTFPGLRIRRPASGCALLNCVIVSLWLANCPTLFNFVKQLLALIRTAGVGHVPLVVAVVRRRQNQFEMDEIENWNLHRAIPSFFIRLAERRTDSPTLGVKTITQSVTKSIRKYNKALIMLLFFLMSRRKFNISFLMSRCVAFEALFHAAENLNTIPILFTSRV